MTRPNKVFLLTDENNFVPQNANLSLENYITIFINALCTGFGPFPIQSVTVSNKIATVNIGETVRIYPGQKISISGTGVSDLDTWHEVDTIHVDGDNNFTFNIDVPDGNYTNGITLSYPGLGWSLVDRNSNTIIIKSGSSGSVTHTVSLEFRNSGTNTFNVRIRRYNGLPITNINDLVFNTQYSPQNHDIITILLTLSTHKNSWYFYGDDAFVCIGTTTYQPGSSSYTYNTTHTVINFGEIKNLFSNSGSFIINGCPTDKNSLNNFYYNSASYYHFSGFLGFGGDSINFTRSNVLINNNKNNINFTSNFFALPFPYIVGNDDTLRYTGYHKYETNKAYLDSNCYSPIGVFNSNKSQEGIIPGIYYLSKQPGYNPLFTYNGANSMFYILTCLGKLKNRKVFAKMTALFTYNNSGSTIKSTTANFNPSEFCNSLFDLTGPIR